MKKLLAVAMCLVMVLSMCVTAGATTNTNDTLVLYMGKVHKLDQDGEEVRDIGITGSSNGSSYTYTFTNVDIYSTPSQNLHIALQVIDTNATINLVGTNNITLNKPNSNAIGISANGSLTITGTGNLTVSTQGDCSQYLNYGISVSNNLTIESGTVTFISSQGGAGYNYGVKCTNLTIKGGTVTAKSPGQAMQVAPDLSNYTGYAVTASTNVDGSSPVATYNASEIATYKYIEIAPASGGTPTHTHSWASAWTSDGTHHWHECTATGCTVTLDSEKNGYAIHTPGTDDNNCTTPIKCTVCEKVTTAAQTHDFTSGSDYQKDESGHSKKCAHAGCNQYDTKKDHKSTGNNVATTEKKAKCDDCGQEYGEKLSATPVTAKSELVKTILSGRYNANQVFDCQRSPATPTVNGADFKASGFAAPYNAETGDALSDYAAKVFYFKTTSDVNKLFALYMSDEDGTNEVCIAAKGSIYGYGTYGDNNENTGFLYVADAGSGISTTEFGYFISSEALASGGSVTFKPTFIGPITDNVITTGNAQEVTKGNAATFVSSAELASLVRVEVDGNTVDAANYTTVSGSTKVTLNAAYVQTLATGNHTLSIVSTGGTASTTFEVKAAGGTGGTYVPPTSVIQSPKTFDAGVALYAGMALASAAGAVYVTRKKN